MTGSGSAATQGPTDARHFQNTPGQVNVTIPHINSAAMLHCLPVTSINDSSRSMLCALLVAVAALGVPTAAAAFTFHDGTTMACTVRGVVVPEHFAGPDDPFSRLGRVGLAEKVGDGYRITWNAQRLKGLPPELHDFVFFHECAHATVPTEIEIEANCAGLKAMRAAGRAGPALENRLRAMYPNIPYWNDTFACADRAGPAREATTMPKG